MDEGHWTVLFRSSNPRYWSLRANSADAFAVPLTSAPPNMRFVRLRRMDTHDYVILPLSAEQLADVAQTGGNYVWSGSMAGTGLGYRAPAIGNLGWRTQEPGTMAIAIDGTAAILGWGFAVPAWADDKQGYTWARQPINPTAFEVAVSSNDLSPDEEKRLLR